MDSTFIGLGSAPSCRSLNTSEQDLSVIAESNSRLLGRAFDGRGVGGLCFSGGVEILGGTWSFNTSAALAVDSKSKGCSSSFAQVSNIGLLRFADLAKLLNNDSCGLGSFRSCKELFSFKIDRG